MSLEELHLGYLNFNGNVLEGSLAVLVPSRFRFNPLYDESDESIISALRAKIVEFKQRNMEKYD